MNNKQKKTYESAITELEQILSQLENEHLPLEESIKQFEAGVELIKFCQGILDNTEQKIKGLTQDETTPDGEDDSPSF